MIGMQFVVQNFPDSRLRVFPGMFAEWTMVADCRSDFFKSTYIIGLHL
jgi:hypothetical protein